MNLKKLATSGAALVALTAPAFLASQAHADTNPALNSPEWTGLHTANDGGSNVAYDNYSFSYLDYAKAIDKLITNHKDLQKQIKDFLNQPLYHPNATKNAYERLIHE